MKVKIKLALFGSTNQKRAGEKEESILFTKGEFDKLMKKNLKMPVSIMHL